MSRIACPYCCTVQTFPDGNKCTKCGTDVPEKYLKSARSKPPFYMAVVGMSSHGKTTYIHSLTHAMDNIGKISRGAFLDALDDETLVELRTIRGQIDKKEATAATQLRDKDYSLQRPMVFSLKSFMTDDRNTLVIYDIAGEAFSERADIQQYAEPLKLAHTVWFMVSLHDLEHGNTDYGSIADLFNIYITGMERAGANPRGRNLHVIYTKADKLTNLLPSEILEYIREDDYSNLAQKSPRDLKDMQFVQDDYQYKLEEISSRLQEFTEYDVNGGMSFINMAEDYGMSLSFSINTAIGRDHTPNNRMIDYESYRVLDPLVYALRENVELGPQIVERVGHGQKGKELALILDTGFSSQNKIYGQKLPAEFFTVLSDLGEVSTYYLGTLKPMTSPGISPNISQMPKETIAFIGPILDQLSENALALLITSQSIRDLQDFHDSDWHRRLGILSFEKLTEVRPDDVWPLSMTYDRSRPPSEQVRDIVRKLFQRN